jgi:addiction module HigA family antidote
MTTATNPLISGLPPVHPGALLREDIIPALGKGMTELKDLLGISRQQLYDIVNEKKPITANTALRFGKLLGDSPEFWLAMQNTYDLKTAEAAMADALASIPTLEAASA